MKKILSIIFILFTSLIYSQEFSRAYLHVNLIISSESIQNTDASSAFTFNINKNLLKFYKDDGTINDYIYLGDPVYATDSENDSYTLIKAINPHTSIIWYFYIYKYDVFMYNEEYDIIIRFYNLEKN